MSQKFKLNPNKFITNGNFIKNVVVYTDGSTKTFEEFEELNDEMTVNLLLSDKIIIIKKVFKDEPI